MQTPSLLYQRTLNRLKMRQLQLLVAVGRHLNIRGAAREVHISQPAATKIIKDLEAELGVALFHRTNRGAIPTPQGAALIRHGLIIFAQLSNAAREMEDLTDGARGHVVVGTLVAGAARLVPRAIHRLQSDRPNVTIKVIEGTNDVLMPRLLTGEIDLVAGRLPVHRHRQDLTQVSCHRAVLDLVVGRDHPLVGQRDLQFEDLHPFGWILPPLETTLRRQISEVFVEMRNYQPPVLVEAVNYLLNRTLLIESQMIGVMPAGASDLDLQVGLLAKLDYRFPFDFGDVGIIHRGAATLSPAAQLFVATLLEVGAEPPDPTSPLSRSETSTESAHSSTGSAPPPPPTETAKAP